MASSPYDPEYDDDVNSAKRKLLELRLRKSRASGAAINGCGGSFLCARLIRCETHFFRAGCAVPPKVTSGVLYESLGSVLSVERVCGVSNKGKPKERYPKIESRVARNCRRRPRAMLSGWISTLSVFSPSRQRLPFKNHEFRELRQFVARLKTSKSARAAPEEQDSRTNEREREREKEQRAARLKRLRQTRRVRRRGRRAEKSGRRPEEKEAENEARASRGRGPVQRPCVFSRSPKRERERGTATSRQAI